MVSAEFAEARGVDQQPDIGFFAVQQSFQLTEAFFFQKIQNNGPEGDGHFGFQGFQGAFPPGNGPDLVHGNIAGQLLCKFPSHAGAGPGNDGDVHNGSPYFCRARS